ncbi:collagen alpha-1(XXIII) chain-like [Arapaima gigas]
MDSAENSKEDKALMNPGPPESLIPRFLVALPTIVCLLLSVSSISFCFLMTFKTSQLENRVHALELEKVQMIHRPEMSFLGEDGSVVPALRETVEKLLQEKLSEALPLHRVTRDLAPHCSCPPGAFFLP